MAIPSLRSRPENPAWQHRSVGFNLLSLSCSALDGINRASGLLRDRVHLRRSIRYLFRLRPGDIFIVSFPKSGTTLMQMMLYQLTTSGEMDFPHIDSVSPWFEAHLQQGDVKGLELSSPTEPCHPNHPIG